MKTITTTLLTALLLTTSQATLAAGPFNLPVNIPVNTPINIPTINPNHLAQLKKPDLIVSNIQALWGTRVLPDNSIEVPISFSVKNVGSRTAGKFKLSVDATWSRQTFVVPFKVRGLGGGHWYPRTRTNISAGNSKYISGVLNFRGSDSGKTVYIRAKADSCSGEEFTRSYCRINERNENNNESRLLRIRLP